MTRKSIKIEYDEYNSIDSLEASDKELLLQAMNAADKAYSPYSGFKVGAAVRLGNGNIVIGNNQENIAYPSGLCAERVALFSAMANNPDSAVDAIAVIGKNSNIYPLSSVRGYVPPMHILKSPDSIVIKK